MTFSRHYRLLLCGLVIAFVSAVCSSGYITPGSLAATAEAESQADAPATAFFTSPTPSQVPSATPSSTAASPTPFVLPSATPEVSPTAAPPTLYAAQTGDTLVTLALHFGVALHEITSPQDIAPGLITPGQTLLIPNVLGVTTPAERLIPDSEVLLSPSTVGFDASAYVEPLGGHIANYREYLPSGWHSGAEVLERVAIENSINPRLLLAILEFQSGWVTSEPRTQQLEDYPIGHRDPSDQGLNHQLIWAIKQLSIGYYGWRDGSLTTLTFLDGIEIRIAPTLNAGSVAIQYLFSRLYTYDDWQYVIDTDVGLPALFADMFPDPWLRAAETEPLYPSTLEQPTFNLPFYSSQIWFFTGGPHGAWEREGAQAALDFAPSSVVGGCAESDHWVTAMAAGTVVRTGLGTLVIDLDGDGYEQTGWVLVYLHLDYDNDFKVGDLISEGQRLGHPSCLGGLSTATHIHIARKYNGEWISAAGVIPFEMSGWTPVIGEEAYKGTLVRGPETVTACTCANAASRISLDP